MDILSDILVGLIVAAITSSASYIYNKAKNHSNANKSGFNK